MASFQPFVITLPDYSYLLKAICHLKQKIDRKWRTFLHMQGLFENYLYLHCWYLRKVCSNMNRFCKEFRTVNLPMYVEISIPSTYFVLLLPRWTYSITRLPSWNLVLKTFHQIFPSELLQKSILISYHFFQGGSNRQVPCFKIQKHQQKKIAKAYFRSSSSRPRMEPWGNTLILPSEISVRLLHSWSANMEKKQRHWIWVITNFSILSTL